MSRINWCRGTASEFPDRPVADRTVFEFFDTEPGTRVQNRLNLSVQMAVPVNSSPQRRQHVLTAPHEPCRSNVIEKPKFTVRR